MTGLTTNEIAAFVTLALLLACCSFCFSAECAWRSVAVHVHCFSVRRRDPVSGKSATWQHHRRRRRITFLPSALPAKAPARSLVSIDGVGVATAFLAHDAARLITGETLYVDGGYHIIRLEHVGLKCRSSRSYRSHSVTSIKW
jgi:Enoyl-(Acyl carrier protein) reductase